MSERILPRVAEGQVWADNDKRCEGRHVYVAHVDETHATVDQCRPDGTVMPRARRTRIRLDRFRPTSTGYRLVRDAED